MTNTENNTIPTFSIRALRSTKEKNQPQLSQSMKNFLKYTSYDWIANINNIRYSSLKEEEDK